MTWSRPERPASSPLTAPTERAPDVSALQPEPPAMPDHPQQGEHQHPNAQRIAYRSARRRVAPPPRTDNMHGPPGAVRALCNWLAASAPSWSSLHVMTAASIGASRGGGYARYLESKTVEPERGDYYLTPDGEMAQAPGRWLADTETLERLGITPGEPVDGADFIALMEGRHPGTGRWLRPEGAGGDRGVGIDVTL